MSAHTDLAERLAPHLAGLIHPGDDDTPPFPLILPTFQASTMPEGLTEADAEELGLPTPNLAKLFLEAVIHLLQTTGGVELIDHAKAVDLRAAAATQEHKRQHTIDLHCRCGTLLGRISVINFDSDRPTVNGPELIRALSRRNPDCSTKHTAAA